MRAWRVVGKSPCEDPPVTISIAGEGLFPWVMTLEKAREIFGPVVDQITEQPQEIKGNYILNSRNPRKA